MHYHYYVHLLTVYRLTIPTEGIYQLSFFTFSRLSDAISQEMITLAIYETLPYSPSSYFHNLEICVLVRMGEQDRGTCNLINPDTVCLIPTKFGMNARFNKL